MPSPYTVDLFNHYEQLKPHIAKLATTEWSLLDTDPYKATVLSALVKNFEFNHEICGRDRVDDFFFLMPFLRGMCEDLITLKYLERYDVKFRSDIIKQRHYLLALESMEAQANFFQKEYIVQPLFRYGNTPEEIIRVEGELKALWHSKGFNKNTIFPSVSAMATDTKMTSLYNYLYHATSRVVHFTPQVLLRMGHGEPGQTMTFDSKSFAEYYFEFTVYHGTYLFLKFIKEAKKLLALDREVINLSKGLRTTLKEIQRCPELITFEEMNKPRPMKIAWLLVDKSTRFEESL